MTDTDICFLAATESAAQIRAKRASCHEVVSAHLRQIERMNPKVNAIGVLRPSDTFEQATRLWQRRHGLGG